MWVFLQEEAFYPTVKEVLYPALRLGLCRDSKEDFVNLLKSGAPDGHFWSPEIPVEPAIAPLSHPRPLSTQTSVKPSVLRQRSRVR